MYSLAPFGRSVMFWFFDMVVMAEGMSRFYRAAFGILLGNFC